MDITTRTFFVAGVQYREEWKDVRTGLQYAGFDGSNGQVEVDLKGEPKNKYDQYAVKCFIAGKHIGYIPKPINVDVWALRDAGYKPNARLVEFNPDGHPWEMFKVEVNFTKKETP